MHRAQGLFHKSGPDSMAACALKLLEQNRPVEAVPLACQAASLAKGNGFFEANALAALALERAGDFDGCLEYWDRIARSAPQKLTFMAAALRAAMRLETVFPEASDKIAQWLKVLDWIYVARPQFELLADLESRGWQGVGAAGINQGRLKGWLWLNRDELPVIRVDGPKKVCFDLSLRPIKANQAKILYSFDEPLPEEACVLTISDSSGKLVTGAPLVIAPATAAKGSGKDKTPQVIIPVYRDRRATLACLGSVFASQKKNRTLFNVRVVWDCGPDARLLADLRRLQARGKIHLLESSANIGFLAGVNHALAASAGDAILLNADTIVHGDWVDRMLAAGTRTDAATVTALSNEAELMSYPGPGDRGRVSNLREVARYDSAAASIDVDPMLEIPVGVGCCMLVTRRAINRIGGLDGRGLFRGYGEEVDFCLRAAETGFKNYGLFNVFIGHLGGRSFGPAKRALAAQNNEVIFERFPRYRRKYEVFLIRPEARQLRERLSHALLRQLPRIKQLELRPWVLRYLPPWIRDEVYKPERKGAVLFLKTGKGMQAILRIWSDIPVAEMNFDLPRDADRLRDAINACGISQFVDLSASAKLRQAFLDLGVSHLAEVLAPESPSLPEFTAAGSAVLLAAPPSTIQGFKALKKAAQQFAGVTIYSRHLDSLWGGATYPANLVPMPDMRDYSCLQAGAFILPDNYADAAAWSEWLAAHGCGDLPMMRPSAA